LTKASLPGLLGCVAFLLLLLLLTGCSDTEAEPAAAQQTSHETASMPITDRESAAPEAAVEPPFPAELLHQKLEPHPINAMLEQMPVSVSYKGQSRFGELLLQSVGDALMQTYSVGKIYSGSFEIVYSDREGNSRTIVQWEQMNLQEHVHP